jgi:hypothetical protein
VLASFKTDAGFFDTLTLTNPKHLEKSGKGVKSSMYLVVDGGLFDGDKIFLVGVLDFSRY